MLNMALVVLYSFESSFNMCPLRQMYNNFLIKYMRIHYMAGSAGAHWSSASLKTEGPWV